MKGSLERLLRRPWIFWGASVLLLSAVSASALVAVNRGQEAEEETEMRSSVGAKNEASATTGATNLVKLDPPTQQAIGLELHKAELATTPVVVKAPGRVAPDESRWAFITPRAAGIVRSVTAQIGMKVKAGDLLATIDSPEVGEARLNLVGREQALEVAKTQAEWQETVYSNVIELLAMLEKGASPDEIHNRFKGRPVGDERERLITAYAQFRRADAALKRQKDLQASDAVSLAEYQKTLADQETAQATYQALMDEMAFQARLERTRSRQSLAQAETALRIAKEKIRILGVPVDAPAGTIANESTAQDAGIASTYALTAPFDGTILDRELVVPGVAVDTMHRIFTLADLSRVWIEVHVYEHNFAALAGGRDAEVRVTSPAYPGRIFPATVLHTGYMVDDKSRTVRLMAQAENADRTLKPGMFVEVELVRHIGAPAVRVPDTALVAESDRTLVFVRRDDVTFERRDVTPGPSHDGMTAILKGLKAGDTVVVRGGSKLLAEAARLTSGGS